MRRLVVLPTVLALSTFSLAACGEEPIDNGKVTVTGAFGETPKVKFSGKLTREESEVDVLSEGKGDTVADGDTARIEWYVGNGFNGEEAYSSFEDDQPATMVTFTKDGVLKALHDAVVGQKVGSRIEVIAAPDDAWGPNGGNAELGIGNADTVVMVIDIVSKVEVKDVDREDVPKPIGQANLPKGFDFSGSPKKPSADLLRATLREGDGATVANGQAIKVKYLGSVYGSSKVFDENFSKGDEGLLDVAVGTGGVIKGWDIGLVGAKVGSRIELVIPSELAYGEGGQGEDIPGGSTLVFLVDIVSAS